jgi:transposase
LHQYSPDQVLPPDVRISSGKFWTVSDLQIAIQRWYNVTYQSDNSYRTLLQSSRFSLQRTENRYRSRPDEATIAEFEAELGTV